MALLGAVTALWPALTVADPAVRAAVATSAAMSVVAFFVTRAAVPIIARRTERAGLHGLDINKKGTPAGAIPIPEALGLAPAAVFLVCIALFQHAHHGAKLPGGLPAASDAWLVDYNAALAAVACAAFLGFADDVLDVPWRVKLVLPVLASLPLVVAYGGGTGIAVPKPLRALFGLRSYLELGALYKLYMVLLAVFCANAINILAGVNGLEVGQTVVIACAVACHNLLAIRSGTARIAAAAAKAGGLFASTPSQDLAAARASVDGHLFSLYLMLPLAATSLGLLWHNWFPAAVFVGDTFTYFAGMALAVAGILGHFSETLLIFLIPQVFNFAYSLPQLFKLVPCPRHRLPTLDTETGLLHPTPNWNLVNLALRVRGPMSERRLCVELLALQAACCAAGFAARHLLQGVYK